MGKEHVKVADPLHPEYERGFIDGMKMQAQRQADRNDMYVAGWNEAIKHVINKVVSTLQSTEFSVPLSHNGDRQLNASYHALLATMRSRLEGMKK